MERAAESMYVPYDEKLKIIPQDDNFLDREPGISEHTIGPLSPSAILPSTKYLQETGH